MPDLNHLPTTAEVFAEMDAEINVEARVRWERTARGRAVANAVVAYRTAHRLSQGALAANIGMKRPARLTAGTGRAQPLNRDASAPSQRALDGLTPVLTRPSPMH